MCVANRIADSGSNLRVGKSSNGCCADLVARHVPVGFSLLQEVEAFWRDHLFLSIRGESSLSLSSATLAA